MQHSLDFFRKNHGNFDQGFLIFAQGHRGENIEKPKNILENITGKRAAFALYGVMQPDVRKGGIENQNSKDELNDKIYLL